MTEPKTNDTHRPLWLAVRQACLMIADAIAKHYDLRTRS